MADPKVTHGPAQARTSKVDRAIASLESAVRDDMGAEAQLIAISYAKDDKGGMAIRITGGCCQACAMTALTTLVAGMRNA